MKIMTGISLVVISTCFTLPVVGAEQDRDKKKEAAQAQTSPHDNMAAVLGDIFAKVAEAQQQNLTLQKQMLAEQQKTNILLQQNSQQLAEMSQSLSKVLPLLHENLRKFTGSVYGAGLNAIERSGISATQYGVQLSPIMYAQAIDNGTYPASTIQAIQQINPNAPVANPPYHNHGYGYSTPPQIPFCAHQDDQLAKPVPLRRQPAMHDNGTQMRSKETRTMLTMPLDLYNTMQQQQAHMIPTQHQFDPQQAEVYAQYVAQQQQQYGQGHMMPTNGNGLAPKGKETTERKKTNVQTS